MQLVLMENSTLKPTAAAALDFEIKPGISQNRRHEDRDEALIRF